MEAKKDKTDEEDTEESNKSRSKINTHHLIGHDLFKASSSGDIPLDLQIRARILTGMPLIKGNLASGSMMGSNRTMGPSYLTALQQHQMSTYLLYCHAISALVQNSTMPCNTNKNNSLSCCPHVHPPQGPLLQHHHHQNQSRLEPQVNKDVKELEETLLATSKVIRPKRRRRHARSLLGDRQAVVMHEMSANVEISSEDEMRFLPTDLLEEDHNDGNDVDEDEDIDPIANGIQPQKSQLRKTTSWADGNTTNPTDLISHNNSSNHFLLFPESKNDISDPLSRLRDNLSSGGQLIPDKLAGSFVTKRNSSASNLEETLKNLRIGRSDSNSISRKF